MSLQATDELVWNCIKCGFCSFKTKTDIEDFCRCGYNVSGLCTRSSCPLANSEYATVMEKKGHIFLMLKTAERAQYPQRLWEHVKLPSDKKEAKHIIKDRLQFSSKFLKEKVMRRYIRILEVQGKMRKLRLSTKAQDIAIRHHVEKQLRIREDKAEKSAKIEEVIKKDLIQKLNNKELDGIFNFPKKVFNDTLQQVGGKNEEIDEEEVEDNETNEEDEINEEHSIEMEIERERDDGGKRMLNTSIAKSSIGGFEEKGKGKSQWVKKEEESGVKERDSDDDRFVEDENDDDDIKEKSKYKDVNDDDDDDDDDDGEVVYDSIGDDSTDSENEVDVGYAASDDDVDDNDDDDGKMEKKGKKEKGIFSSSFQGKRKDKRKVKSKKGKGKKA